MKQKWSSLRSSRPRRATSAVRDITRLEDVPNVGPAVAAVGYMEGGPKKPWWKYTAERKRELEARKHGSQ